MVSHPSIELGTECISVIYKGYYYRDNQSWNGVNEVVIFEQDDIGKAIKSFFKGFGESIKDDYPDVNAKDIECNLHNWVDSLDRELIDEFKNVMFKYKGE